MYADGIEENPLSQRPTTAARRRRRRGRHSVHRYPHKTHQRRPTEHSFADQGPTHYGQQHPFHPGHPDEFAHQTHPVSAHPELHPETH